MALTGWICYVAAILTSWIPFIGAALFLAVIILGIVCLLKDETKHGIALLLCGIVTPAILFYVILATLFGAAATRLPKVPLP